jgi:hypothetical protein
VVSWTLSSEALAKTPITFAARAALSEPSDASLYLDWCPCLSPMSPVCHRSLPPPFPTAIPIAATIVVFSLAHRSLDERLSP